MSKTYFRGFAPFIILLSLLAVLMPIRAAMPAPLQGQTLQGVLEYEFGDSADHTIAPARYFLSAGETRTELLFDTAPWYGYLGKQVVVEGTVTMQGEVASTMQVSRVSLAVGEQAALSTPVTGTRKVILLLVKFSGDSQEPHAQSWYTGTIFNPSSGNTVNSFYLANSWGQFGWSADATVWMTGLDAKTTYANCGWSSVCADLTHLFNDAVALGVANGVNFALYDNIAIVTNNDLDCCAWGGSRTYGGKSYGVVWEPPWSAQVGTFAHELGHSIGLYHSGWVYYAYDSPWDVMSQGDQIYNNVNCGSYNSANSGGTNTIYCPTPADIIAPYKDVLGWIGSSCLLTVTAGSPASVQVDTSAAPLSGSKKMIKICVAGKDCTSGGATAQYYTVEVRTHYTASPGFDYYLQNEGVIIHYYWGDWTGPTHNSCYFNYQFGPAYPIDNFNVVTSPHYAGPPSCSEYVGSSYDPVGLRYANWNDGQTFTATGISIAIVSHSTVGGVTTYLVSVNGTPSYTVTFMTNPTSWSGSAGSITVDGSSTYTNGQTGSYTGTHSLVVYVPSGYQFVWVAGNRNPPQSDPTGVYVPNISANPTTMDVNGNGWLKATFAAVITFHTNTGTGSISYGSQLYTDGQTRAEANLPPDYGNTVQITANPPTGVPFVSWSVSGMLTVDSTSSQTTTLHVNGPGTLTANFNVVQTIPISSAGTDVVNAPAGGVIYVLPDWQSGSGHTKPSDVQPAALSDFTALGFMFGASDNMQIMALDTNSTYVDPATGAPKVSNSVLVVFAGPLVNGVVNYYEDSGMSPLYFTFITVGGVPTYAFYDWQGNLAASMPVSAGQAGSSDVFLVEYFKDANNNNVFIIYGFAWKGTYTSGVFFKTYILPNIAGFTHGWYIYQWNDTNGNGLPDPYEVNTTPVNYGD